MTERRDEDRRNAEDEERRAETERRGEQLREAWRRRRKKPEDPAPKPGHGRRPEGGGKGKR